MTVGGFDTVKNPSFIDVAKNTDGYARHYLVESIAKGIGGNQKEFVEVNDTPLCIIQGENDQCINNKFIIENVNYKNLFNHKVYIIENCKHAVFWEKPAEFNRVLSEFLCHIT